MRNVTCKLTHGLTAGALLGVLAGMSTALGAGNLVTNQALELRHPPGFTVTRFATREQVPNATSLTLDSQGRVVVSGRGWIRRLEDTDADGKADKVTTFAETATGARGMVFIGNDLYLLADGSFGRLLDPDGNGVADGTPQRFFDFGFGPEGVQTLRRGPDGHWYILAGQDSRLGPAHWNFPGTPIRNPEGAALVHISPDLSRSQVVAQGFLHAHDFDFHATGAMLIYDHGYARDGFLPWMAMPRLLQVAHGAHHGWRTSGTVGPRALPEYDPAQVPVLWSANTGVPAGLTFYRHHQFPSDYRGGLFSADWESGRVQHFKLQPFQSGFTAAVQPFLEPTGRNGFTPTAMAVGPDGSLYLATGGRGTGSGVYRVQFTQLDPKTGKLPDQPPPFLGNFDAVLRAPQRLEAWSRANWVPLAVREGRKSFEQVAMSIGDPEDYKLVALEVITELLGGVTRWEANVAAKSAFPSVRARTAWALARNPFEGYLPILQELLRDESALVRRAALEVYVDHAPQLPALELFRVAGGHLDHEDQRVREAAITLASRLPEELWQRLGKEATTKSLLHRLSLIRALLLRDPVGQQPNQIALREAVAVLRQPEKGTPLLGLTALKLITQAFGDTRFKEPSAEAFAGYELRISPGDHPALAADVLSATRPLFPTGNPIVDAELARTLALFEDPDPNTPLRMLGAFGAQSPVPSDIHYLACFARLNPGGPVPALTNLAEVFLWLDNKAGETGAHPSLQWKPRVLELASRLMARHPEIGDALVRSRNFADPGRAWLAAALSPAQRDTAREQFFAASTNVNRFNWNAEVINLLAEKASEELATRLRGLWSRTDLHDAIVKALAATPTATDYPWYVGALGSADFRTVAAALTALTELEDRTPRQTLAPVMRVFHRAVAQPAQATTRKAAIGWLKKHAGWKGVLEETNTDRPSLELTYRPLLNWFATEYPAVGAAIAGMSEEEFKYWETQLKDAPWTLGKLDRGANLFKERRCAECHGGGPGFGPDLAGAARLRSPEGLLRTVVYPHLDVAPGAGVVELRLRDGTSLTGIVVFESLEHLLLRQENGDTVRVTQGSIAQRRVTHDSTMPLGLLKGVNARGLADLYSYLETLK